MKPYHTDNHITLYQGDALDVLRMLPDASVHAVVTDPPSGIAFMNMEWDKDRGGRAQWVAWLTEIMREVYRVLKPGAHGLVWALPRTSHWTACALEDAGFEIRDKITHIFSTGFPKALDISKAIDAELGATRDVVGERVRMGDKQSYTTNGNSVFPCKHTGNITAPATPEASQWDGWKTALKPAAEEWLLVRKPLSERNVARNVLQHGTGGLNVDACRVGTREHEPQYRSRSDSGTGNGGRCYGSRQGVNRSYTQGRYPPHVVFSHAPDCTDTACVEGCPVRELGEQSGVTPSSARPNVKGHDDTVAAARFFPCFRYEPKAPPKERKGSAHPTQKSIALMMWLVQLGAAEGQTVLDLFAGSGTTLVAARNLGRRAIGVEMDAGYCETIVGRLAQQALPLFGEEPDA